MVVGGVGGYLAIGEGDLFGERWIVMGMLVRAW